MPLAYYGVAALAITTALGTYERSALVGLVVLAAYMLMQSRRKALFGCLIAVIAVGIVYSASHTWDARIRTIGHFEQENSAYTRILVWKWTLGYVATHPLGGGFSAYLIDHIDFPPDDLHPGGFTEFGRAFHSIYFEMLGEQGFPGLVMFLAIAGLTMLALWRLARRTRKIPELAWCADFSAALQSGLAVFLTSGAFVGIAFQPIFWYFIAMSISLRAYVWRVEQQQLEPRAGWRRAIQATAASGGAWRNRHAGQAVNVRLR
jgi:probable O-glycosylation ligase (exosortase A-associated)